MMSLNALPLGRCGLTNEFGGSTLVIGIGEKTVKKSRHKPLSITSILGQRVKPLGIRGIGNPVSIEIGTAVLPPNGATLTKRYLGLLYVSPSQPQLRCVARCFSLLNLTSSCHKLIYQTLPCVLSQRRIGTSPKLPFDNKVTTVRCHWMHPHLRFCQRRPSENAQRLTKEVFGSAGGGFF